MPNIYDGFKDVIGLAKEYDKLDLYEKIVDLQAKVNEIQQKSIEKDKIINKKNIIISDLKKDLEFNEELVYDKKSNCYYSTNENNEPIGQPYCARCWEKDNIAIHLITNVNNKYKNCPECNITYIFDR